jgi:hypothetical protein
MAQPKLFRVLCLITGTLLVFSSCKKEEQSAAVNRQEWMRVLEDTIFNSTDDEIFQGRNGKVLTDSSDNLYLYYYNGLTNQSVVMMCDANGNPVWKKYFPDCEPMDMIKAGDDLVLAVSKSPLLPNGLVLYIIHPDGSTETRTITVWNAVILGVNNACMATLLDNTVVLSGSYDHQNFVNGPIITSGFIMRLDGSFSSNWAYYLEDVPNLQLIAPRWGQNSILPLKTNQFLFEFSISRDKAQNDSCGYGLMTGLITPLGTLTSLQYTPTGYLIRSTGVGAGYANRYCNGLIRNSSGAVYHYSSPDIFRPPGPARPNGFLMLDDNGVATDTLDISIPAGYRILSCTRNGESFLLAAYKTGIASGTNDFGASQTLFLYGESWETTTTFTLQGFYADFFPAAAPTSDGGFVMMGKIQSFNGTANKLALVKWKMDN